MLIALMLRQLPSRLTDSKDTAVAGAIKVLAGMAAIIERDVVVRGGESA